MKNLVFAVFVLFVATVNAQVYMCPPFYPGKGKPTAPITGGRVMWGELHGDGWLMGHDAPVKDGYDTQYGFPDGEGWLVCLYGGRKRTKGDLGWAGTEWWMKLGPKVGQCNVQVREAKSVDGGKSMSTVTAICK